MISVQITLDDFYDKKAPFYNGKRQIRHQERRVIFRNRPYPNSYDRLRQENTPYYTRNYNHGHSTGQVHDKFIDPHIDQPTENRRIYRRDYYHGSVPIRQEMDFLVKNFENNKEKNVFYRRNYFQSSKATYSTYDSNRTLYERSNIPESTNRNLMDLDCPSFANNNVTTPGPSQEESKVTKNILRPPVLTSQSKSNTSMSNDSNDNSTPRIREIVSISNPILNIESKQPSVAKENNATTNEQDNIAKVVSKHRAGQKSRMRRTLALMRQKVAKLSIQAKEIKKANSSATATTTDNPFISPVAVQPSTSSTDDNTPSVQIDKQQWQNLINCYRCSRCKSFCLPELYECTAGHVVCEECWLGLSRCASCDDQLGPGFRRARGMENLARFFKFPCKWENDGCTESFESDAWRDHVADCKYLTGKPVDDGDKKPSLIDSGFDSDDDVVVILDDDDEYEFASDQE